MSPVRSAQLKEIPRAWFVGIYELELDQLTKGRLSQDGTLIEAATGTAWLRLPCAAPPIRPHLDTALHGQLSHTVEVVADVLHPQTQISLAEAAHLGHEVMIGETISLVIVCPAVTCRRLSTSAEGSATG